MNPWWYELLDRDPILYVPVILLGTFLIYHFLNPVYQGKIYRRGDNRKHSQWNQIVDGPSTFQPKKEESK